MKKCTKCLQVKELSNFSKRKTSSDGLQHRCKACVSHYDRHIYAPFKKNITEKVCSVCKVLKDITLFHVRHERPIGVESSCKSCRMEKQKANNRKKDTALPFGRTA